MAADGDGILHSLAPGDLRRLPWVLFYPKTDSEEVRRAWLGNQPAVVLDYQEWLGQRRRTSPLVALLHELLRFYPADLPTFGDWLELLRRSVNGARSPALQQLDPDLFLRSGDRKVVARMVADRQADVEKLGLTPGLARCEFLRSGARKVMRATSQHIRSGKISREEIDGLLNVLELDDGLRFRNAEMYRETAEALLLPFAEKQDNNPLGMEKVCAWFVRRFGDPRLHAHGYRWRDVPDEARKIVVKWLVRGTFEQFFQLLQHTAYDRHWRYRQAFWKRYLQHNMVEEAWFVLGTRARTMLRRISNKESTWNNGTLAGAASDQSVLLMRIGGVTIAEWSHNGSCRIWCEENVSAPRLYDDDYARAQLVCNSADFVQPHHSSASGGWQSHVARQIKRYTGRTVATQEVHYDGTVYG